MKSRDRKSQRRQEKRRKRKSKKRKSQKKEDPGARKGRKVAKHCVFPMICGFGGSKGRLVKRRVRSHLARWEIKSCTPLWRQAHFQVKMCTTHHARTAFGSWHVEKVHAVVARSTFRSQNVKRTRGLNHFWTFRCRFAWQVQGIVHLVKRGFCTSFSYNHRYTTLHYTPLQTQNYNYNYITLHYATLH